MKDKKNLAMIIIVGIVIALFLFVNTTVFATTGTVVGSELRLRKEESTSSEILDLLDENDKVEILSQNGDWYKVKANNKVGYVNKKYIKVNEGNNSKNEVSTNQNTENNVSSSESNASNENTQNNASENKQNDVSENTQNNVSKEENNKKEEPQNTETVTNTQSEEPQNIEANKPVVKNVKFSSDAELKVMPLINGLVINTANSTETYELISIAGLWSYVKCGEKSGWVLTEKTTPTELAQNTNEQNTNSTENNKTETTQNNVEPEKNTANQEQKEENKSEKTSTEKTYSSAKTYYVQGTSVNARSSASKDADVVKVLNTNNSVKVTGEDGNWYVVEINGKKAYISKSLLSTKKVEVTSRSSNSLAENNNQTVTVTTEQNANPAPQPASQPAPQPEPQPKQEEPVAPVASNPSGDAIVAYAKNFLGYRYVYGTNGPNTFDCSGFVQYVYKHFGYSLSRSSGTQANDGVAVSKSNLQPGDVLIFRDTSNTRIGHVGIYIGGDQFIHASNSKTGVIISSLSSASYQKRYVGARRIL